MGSNKRYADLFDRLMDGRILEALMREMEPQSLTRAELDLEHEALTRPPLARPVRAWIRYGETPVQVDALATAWTESAVAVRWKTPNGEHRAWVWSSAVRPASPS